MKKGQVTIFVIISIVVIAIIFFLVYLRGGFTFIQQTSSLEQEIDAVNQHIMSCLRDISTQELIAIGKQGGYVTQLEGSYRLYNDTKISYLCYDIKGSQLCRNRLLVKSDIESNLEKDIAGMLGACINIKEFEKNNIQITQQSSWQIAANIGDESVLISMDYPIKIVSKTSTQELRNSAYSISVNVPLGNLYKISNKILNDETTISNFDPLPFMLENPSYKIVKIKPYPDKIYIIRKTGSDYVFQFAIQGESL